MYLLDTNIVSYYLRGEGRVAEQIHACAPGDLSVSVLTDFELRYGALKAGWSTQRWNTLARALQVLIRVPLDIEAAHSAGEIRAQLERSGHPIGLTDLLIAATAHTRALTLVTRNTAEFKRVTNLKVENWF